MPNILLIKYVVCLNQSKYWVKRQEKKNKERDRKKQNKKI